MGEFCSVACVGFLVEGAGVCVLVGRAGHCLSVGQGCAQCCVLGYLRTYYDFGSLSSNGWYCDPVLLVIWHDMCSPGACWPLGGAGS